MAGSQRIGIYGGTFDPVHNAHTEVARRILSLFELDEVIFVPAYVAPHKMNTSAASPFHRFAMLALATEADDRLQISTMELEAPEQPYTVETIARMQKQLGENARLFFIMGSDSWAEITTWRDWEHLLQACDHIVVTRPGYDVNFAHVPRVAGAVVDLRSSDKEAAAVAENPGPNIFIVDAVMLDISATDIRAAARAGDAEKLRKLVPARVADYIEKYRLYEN